MKNFKRFASVVMVIMMMLSMMIPAMAASITIVSNPGELGTDTTETYKAYKIFDATISGDNIAYTIEHDPDNAPNPFYTVIDNFTTGEGDDETDVFDLTRVNQTNTYIVTAKVTDYDAALLAEALKAVITDDTDVAGEASSANDKNEYLIDNLSEGYYLITSTLGSKMIIDTLKTETIETKNSYPSLTKKIVDGDARVDEITADYGNTITFEITVNIPDSVNGDIVVHDTLDADMEFDALTNATGVTVLEDCEDEDCEGNVHFTIDYDAVTKDTDKNVKFQYTATLKANVLTATAHPNTAWLTYSEFTSVKDTVNVYTYQIDVYKHTGTGENKTGLAGAGFVLMNEEGKYYNNTAGVVTWVEAIADATEYVTEENAYTVVFAGLKNGTYTLHEKTVPVGYNPAQDVDVTISNANKSGAAQVEVENKSGTELPSTGGIGTTIFYCVGAVLAVGAFVLLITKKRMSREM